MKVETHNHPTAISPFPGAATGSGGEIRDEGATGPRRQAEGRARRLHRFEPAHSRASSSRGSATSSASRRASPRALDDHARGPDRRRGVQQRIRPAESRAAISARSSSDVDGEVRGYHKPIMIAGGLGNVARACTSRSRRAAGRAADRARRPGDADRPRRRRGVVAWAAAPARRISTSLRCSAATPRSSGARRKSSTAAGRSATTNPILLDPRRRRRRPVERAARARRTTPAAAARIDLRAMPSDEPGMSPMRDLVQRGAGALRARDRAGATSSASRRSASASAVRSRWSASRPTTAGSSCAIRSSTTRRSTCRSTCCSASRRSMLRDVRACARACRRVRSARHRRRARRPSACCASRRSRTRPSSSRSATARVGGMIRARSDGRPVAGAGRRRRGHAAATTRLHAAKRWRWASARRSRCSMRPASGAHGGRPRRSPTSPPPTSRAIARREAVGELDGRGGASGRRRGAVRRRCAPSAMELCPALGISIPVGKDSLSMKTTLERGRRDARRWSRRCR